LTLFIITIRFDMGPPVSDGPWWLRGPDGRGALVAEGPPVSEGPWWFRGPLVAEGPPGGRGALWCLYTQTH